MVVGTTSSVPEKQSFSLYSSAEGSKVMNAPVDVLGSLSGLQIKTSLASFRV